MFKLEETFGPGGIHIVRNGGSAQGDRLSEHALKTGMEAVEFRPFQVASHPPGPDPCPEKTLVGIDIPHSMQELLIEQGSLDGGAAGTKERGKIVPGYLEGLLASSGEAFRFLLGVSVESQTPESARIDKTQLSPRGQMQDAMGMPGNGSCRIGDQQPPSHAQMHDPLQSRMLPLGRLVFQVENDMFAYTVNAVDAPSGQFPGHCLWRRLEGLTFLAEPCGFNAVSTKALIDPSCDGFNFR